MNKKVLTLSAVMASMLFGAAAHAADTRIGVTIYKYDDNFMSVVRKAIEQDAKAAPDVQLLMNDSQNDQSKQNDQPVNQSFIYFLWDASSIPNCFSQG